MVEEVTPNGNPTCGSCGRDFAKKSEPRLPETTPRAAPARQLPTESGEETLGWPSVLPAAGHVKDVQEL
jgi:hypothetical protein